MSRTATREAWDAVEDANISSKAVLVLVALAHFHNQETGRCNPSISRIEKRTKLTRKTVKRAIAELRQAKLLAVYYRKMQGAGGKMNLPNNYVILAGGRVTVTPGVGSPRPPKVEDKSTRASTSAFYDLANLIESDD